MARVFVSVGTNQAREASLRCGLSRLARRYGVIDLSPVYRTTAVGFEGDDFFNLVVAFDTDQAPAALVAELHRIESDCGRVRGGPRFGPRTLDLDLLLYDDLVLDRDGLQLPRDEILRHAFVLRPLADLAPERRHPVTGRTFAEHWAGFGGEAGGMVEVHPALAEDA